MSQKRAHSHNTADRVATIKKYANRRLYNTATSSYVTLDDLRMMVQQGIDFREVLTHAVLTQIIVEAESRGQNLLPISFLRQIIAMYEDNMRWTLPQYLETVMGWYTRYQGEVQRKFSSMGGTLPPGMEEIQRNQLALFDQAIRMFNPMAGTRAGPGPGAEAATGTKMRPADITPAVPPMSGGTESDDIHELRQQIAELRQAVARLAQKE